MSKSKTPWEQAAEWFARTLAIVVVMVAPGALGSWLDGRLETNFAAPIGFVFGMILATTMLIIFTRIKPVDNDGEIMNGQSNQVAAGRRAHGLTTLSVQKPSESRLPDLPGAEVLEEPRDD